MQIIVTDFDGKDHTLDAVEGWRVMEIIRDYGLPIKAECGGSCACATCHVYVAPEWVDKLTDLGMIKSDDEEDMLDEVFDLQDNSRLSCQIIMSEALDGIHVTLAPC